MAGGKLCRNIQADNHGIITKIWGMENLEEWLDQRAKGVHVVV